MLPTTLHPPLPGTQALMERTTVRVLRRVRTGESTLRTPQFVWQQVATVRATIQGVDGALRMGIPGMTVVTTHRLFTPYRLAKDRKPVVRPRDIVVTPTGEAYLVRVVVDEGDAQAMLRADLEQGTLNRLQALAEQG